MKEVKKEGFVAMNKDEFDLENMSFFNTEEAAIKSFGGEQFLVKVSLTFSIPEMTKSKESCTHPASHVSGEGCGRFFCDKCKEIIHIQQRKS